MTLISPDAGRNVLLKFALANAAAGTYTISLYKNNYTPDTTSILSSFTLSTDPSYANVTLTPASWTVAVNAGVCAATYPSVTFTFSGTETLYGYFIENTLGTTVLWAEAFASPFSYGSGGGYLIVNPTITLSN